MKITVIQKGNPRRVYLVKLNDWLNPDKFVINAQVPYIGSKDMIQKAEYTVEEYLDKNGDKVYVF